MCVGGVCVRCALGMYRKTLGAAGEGGHRIKGSSDTEFTNAVLQKTRYFLHG